MEQREGSDALKEVQEKINEILGEGFHTLKEALEKISETLGEELYTLKEAQEKVNEIIGETRIKTPLTIKSWEKKGYIKSPKNRTACGWRLYTLDEIKEIVRQSQHIYSGRYMGNKRPLLKPLQMEPLKLA